MTRNSPARRAAAPELKPISEEVLDALEPAWWDLVRSADGSFFQTPLWVRAWWEGTGRPPGQLAWWASSDSLDALVGLVEQRAPLVGPLRLGVRVMQTIGSGAGSADHATWVTTATEDDPVLAWLGASARHRSLLLHGVPNGVALSVPRAQVIQTVRCPRLVLGAEDDRSATDAKLKKKIRYYRRRLEQEGIELRVVEPGVLEKSALDDLYELNVARHEDVGRASVLDPAARAVHALVIERSTTDAGAYAVVARQGGRPIGILYGFFWNGVVSYFNSGWTPTAGTLSLGTVLIDEALAWARQQGATVFDFLRGPEPYKYRFGAKDELEHTWLVPRGLGGAALTMRAKALDRRSRSSADD